VSRKLKKQEQKSRKKNVGLTIAGMFKANSRSRSNYDKQRIDSIKVQEESDDDESRGGVNF
jgi:hypothetical protein